MYVILYECVFFIVNSAKSEASNAFRFRGRRRRCRRLRPGTVADVARRSRGHHRGGRGGVATQRPAPAAPLPGTATAIPRIGALSGMYDWSRS